MTVLLDCLQGEVHTLLSTVIAMLDTVYLDCVRLAVSYFAYGLNIAGTCVAHVYVSCVVVWAYKYTHTGITGVHAVSSSTAAHVRVPT